MRRRKWRRLKRYRSIVIAIEIVIIAGFFIWLIADTPFIDYTTSDYIASKIDEVTIPESWLSEIRSTCDNFDNQKTLCYWRYGEYVILSNIKYNSSVKFPDMIRNGKEGDCKLISLSFAKLMKKLGIKDIYIATQVPKKSVIYSYLFGDRKISHVCVIGYVDQDEIREFYCDPSMEFSSIVKI